MGDFYCTQCGMLIKPSLGATDKDGVIQGKVTKCPRCGSNQINYDTN